jgi:chromosomal replication initiation ATPase DnaA
MTDQRGRQLVLDLPLRAARGREDFLVTPSNAAAVAMIDRYPDWPTYAMILAGPAGSGKSHLIEVWRQMSGARIVLANDLGSLLPDALLANGRLAIDNAPGVALDERALFHLLNLARQTGGHILLASEDHPVSWHVGLPDLASRLQALPVAQLDPPDDVLLRGVLVKLFADRQLAIDEQVISYMMLRMPRSLDAARGLVAEIDQQALEEKAAVTRPLVARVMQRFTAPDLFADDA